jgi:transposase
LVKGFGERRPVVTERVEARTFVGVDAHSDHCNLKGVSRQGKVRLDVEVPTTMKDLRAAVKDLPGPVWVMLEASSMAPFVKWAFETRVDRVVVCETRENRWIAKSEDKSDPRDADRLARLLRMGEFKEVHVPKRDRQELREMVYLCDKAVRDVSRLKNRLKAKFRAHGVAVRGETVYSEKGRQVWLDQIKRPTVRFMIESIYGSMDAAEAVRDRLTRRLGGMLSRRRDYRRIKGIPGVGRVTASLLVAIIDDPWRFRDKRKLWKYAGLGVSTPWTGSPDKARARGSKTGNRLLKYAAMTAAKCAVAGDNPLGRQYARMKGRGMEPAMALKTVARKILATALAIWKGGAKYRAVG